MAGFVAVVSTGGLLLIRYGAARFTLDYEPPIDLALVAAFVGPLVGVSFVGVLFGTFRAVSRRGDDVRGTVLTPDGVDLPPSTPDGARTFVAWSSVTGIAVRRSFLRHHVCLQTSDQGVVPLDLVAAWRRDDPRLAEALQVIQGYARQRGVRCDGPVRPPFGVVGRSVVTGLIVIGLLGYAHLATFPVVPPWTPHAVRIPNACEALVAAGLDRYWPRQQRESSAADQASWSTSGSSRCTVRRGFDSETNQHTGTEWQRITVSIERYEGFLIISGASQAYEEVARVVTRAEGAALRQLSIGDIGYLYRFSEGTVHVEVSRGDVVVRIEAESEGDTVRQDSVATRLAAGVLKQIEFA